MVGMNEKQKKTGVKFNRTLFQKHLSDIRQGMYSAKRICDGLDYLQDYFEIELTPLSSFEEARHYMSKTEISNSKRSGNSVAAIIAKHACTEALWDKAESVELCLKDLCGCYTLLIEYILEAQTIEPLYLAKTLSCMNFLFKYKVFSDKQKQELYIDYVV